MTARSDPGDTSGDLDRLRHTWQTLGADDPLWAVLTESDRRRGRWQIDEFLATGEVDVARYEALLREHAGMLGRPESVMDFGCGVGRLSIAWSRRADQVIGVDISSSMIEVAGRLAAQAPNVRFVLNERGDLRDFGDASFDLVFSHICLQHMPWSLARNYITEFGRIVRDGGTVAFQLPTSGPPRLPIRRRIVDGLPAAMRTRYRRWRHGTDAVFEMHYTPRETVTEVARRAGLTLLHAEPDDSAGPGMDGFCYLFRRPESPA